MKCISSNKVLLIFSYMDNAMTAFIEFVLGDSYTYGSSWNAPAERLQLNWGFEVWNLLTDITTKMLWLAKVRGARRYTLLAPSNIKDWETVFIHQMFENDSLKYVVSNRNLSVQVVSHITDSCVCYVR